MNMCRYLVPKLAALQNDFDILWPKTFRAFQHTIPTLERFQHGILEHLKLLDYFSGANKGPINNFILSINHIKKTKVEISRYADSSAIKFYSQKDRYLLVLFIYFSGNVVFLSCQNICSFLKLNICLKKKNNFRLRIEQWKKIEC